MTTQAQHNKTQTQTKTKPKVTATITIGLVESDPQLRDTLQTYLSTQTEFSVLICVSSIEHFKTQLFYLNAPDVLVMGFDLPGLSVLDGIRLIKQDSPKTQVMMLTPYPDTDRIFAALTAGANGYLLKNTSLSDIKHAIIELNSGGSPMSPTIARKVLSHFHRETTKPTIMPSTKPAANPATSQLPTLTKREQQIVDALVDGLSYKQIALRLSIGLETVRHHIKNVYAKFHVHSKSQVIAKVISAGGYLPKV
ncbi:MAG: DNA-binding NarL/FixJ family response regulator [Phenylobacterium sp.]|jgi:DNA-binding NarL/FixJ family response regulator